MIIAIEGPSAAGKTRWSRAHCPQNLIEEASKDIVAPDLYADPLVVAEFWVNHNISRWQNARHIERERGVALCDSEPFNLRFSWSAWKAGIIDRALFDIEFPLYRRAVEDRKMGFADITLWMDAPLNVLRQRAADDATRRRKRHETYLRMIPWMRAWVEAKNLVLPGSLREWSESTRLEDLTAGAISRRRYDAAVVDEMIERLALETTQHLARETMPNSRSVPS